MKKRIILLVVALFSLLLVSCQKENEEEGIKVVFDVNGGTQIEPMILEESSLINAPLFPSKEGHVFRGWFEDNKLTIPWDFNTSYITSTKTLYAKWLKSEKNYQESFKVLSIGNSFSEDAHKYLFSIAKSAGIPEANIHIANMYIAGADLLQHASNLKTNSASYTLQTYTSEKMTSTDKYKLENIIKYDDWDVITFQQASHYSGVKEKYEQAVVELTNWALENAINPNVKIGWHQTWAYEKTSTHSGFLNYDKDQMKMYEMINEAMKEKVFSTFGMSFIIPSGTAVQNARTSYVGDNFTKDGYHLTDPFGRYIAALTFYGAITGYNLDEVVFLPSGLSNDEKIIAFEAVKNALIKPLGITESTYKEK